ncbi:MAG: hypothetical protein OHM77_00830 [Candidatus Nitricoxidivorans perseverans]|uniref:Secreted protein n=1 Tax=Candidatus Nitricoxidivorans perseverans TaxID=2975601 RepID=A0AA49IZQ8_9PROT|nr:MAG: hypothetical protein OHM77_00830 [Candidatus Nitricoxidivorans perseverans]
MKTIHLLATVVLGFTGSAYAADKHDHGHEHASLHGGIVTEVKDMDYEFVAKPDRLQLHLRDHGKAVDVSKASAKVTLLAGTEKQEVELKPAGDKLEAVGAFKVAAGAKAVVLVSLPGKPAATARFVLK